MPKLLETKLEKSARKKGLTGKKKNAYVYGTMNKMKKISPMMQGKKVHMA